MKKLTFRYSLRDCPPPVELVKFRQGKLPKKLDDDIAHHLTFCKVCSAKATALEHEPIEETPVSVEMPEGFMERLNQIAGELWNEHRRETAQVSIAKQPTAPLSRLANNFSVDLGTSNIRIYSPAEEVLINEPALLAVNRRTGRIEAVGKSARELLEEARGDIISMTPVRHGVIADAKFTTELLDRLVQKARNRRLLLHTKVAIINVANDSTPSERQLLSEWGYRCEAQEVHVISDAVSAAVGVGLRISEPGAWLIVDIGGGATEVAIITPIGIIFSRSIRVAGNEMDEAIRFWLKSKHNLLIAEYMAERIKIEIGSAYPLERRLAMEIKGDDVADKTPKRILVTDPEVREALSECVSIIINAIQVALDRLPPELSGEIREAGIILTGGGALLRNLEKRISEKLGVPVRVADDPLTSVVRRSGMMLADPALLSTALTIGRI